MNDRLEVAAAIVEGSAVQLCPYDTGFLEGSITHEVVPAQHTAFIGATAEYAPHVELGTSEMGAQPFLVPALINNKENIRRILNANA